MTNRPQCRICLEHDPGEDLFSPCLCNGSVKYVHKECLETWVLTTTNPDAKEKCMMCGETFLLKPPPSYPLSVFCISIDHNGVIIFCFNLSIAILFTLLYNFLFAKEPFASGMEIVQHTCLFCSTLTGLEILYAFLLICNFSVQCSYICIPVFQLLSPLLMLVMCGAPVSLATAESTPGIFTGVCLITTFVANAMVSIFFSGIDKYLKENCKHRILPRQVEEIEENKCDEWKICPLINDSREMIVV